MILEPVMHLAVAFGLVVPPADTVRARVVATISEDSPRTPFMLGEVSGLAIDASGRLYVTDFQDPRVVVFGTDGRQLALIGRKGNGPGEFTAPTGPVFGADGALYVRNMEQVARFGLDAKTGIASRFDRFFEGPPLAPWRSKLASAIDTRGRFHFPLEVGLRDGITHYAYQRYGLDGKKLDSLPVPVQPTARSSWASVPVAKNTGRMVKGVNVVPFHPIPVWAITSSGTVLGGPGDRYELTETDIAERPLRKVLRVTPSEKIPAAERAESTAALKRRIDSLPVPLSQVNGASEEVKAIRLPQNYPAYRGVTISASGEAWVRRWSPPSQRAQSLFDVFSAAGAYRHTVSVPADCATLPAPVVRGSTIACVAIDRESGAETVILATMGR